MALEHSINLHIYRSTCVPCCPASTLNKPAAKWHSDRSVGWLQIGQGGPPRFHFRCVHCMHKGQLNVLAACIHSSTTRTPLSQSMHLQASAPTLKKTTVHGGEATLPSFLSPLLFFFLHRAPASSFPCRATLPSPGVQLYIHRGTV